MIAIHVTIQDAINALPKGDVLEPVDAAAAVYARTNVDYESDIVRMRLVFALDAFINAQDDAG